MKITQLLWFLLLSGLLLHKVNAAETQITSISLSSGNEISATIYPANGKKLILWFYSEAGPQKSDEIIADQLSQMGYETWRVDLFNSYFLPVSISSMDKLPAKDISEYIKHVRDKSGKTLITVTTGRSAIPLLRARHEWQQQNNLPEHWPGLILISPKFYLETPEPGVEATIMPIVKQSNSLLFVMQPAKSPWFWKLDQTIPALEKSGSDVFVQRLSGVRDRFYFRPDAIAYEQQQAENLPALLANAVIALDKFPLKKRQAVALKQNSVTAVTSKKDRSLRAHQGKSEPASLVLKSLSGPVINLADQKGKVVLVNFWASWCPPCVHEMPSMQRIQKHFGEDDFIILGVNMAEDPATINTFLREKVSVTFPILLDADGAALKRWQVFAFPTSYVIDKSGKIRYSLFGSIEWDENDALKKLTNLVNE